MLDTRHTLYEIEVALAESQYFDFVKNIVAFNVNGESSLLPLGHECDMLVMSKSGYLTEIEIKRSWSDFKADFKKGHHHEGNGLIKRFYYAVPYSIAKKVSDYIVENHIPCDGVYYYTEDLFVRQYIGYANHKDFRKLTTDEQFQVARYGAMRCVMLKKKINKLLVTNVEDNEMDTIKTHITKILDRLNYDGLSLDSISRDDDRYIAVFHGGSQQYGTLGIYMAEVQCLLNMLQDAFSIVNLKKWEFNDDNNSWVLKLVIKDEEQEEFELDTDESDELGKYDYVDLGLPSHLLWAKCNVGANTPEEAGLYFQWGDTQGYTADQIGNGENQKAFTWDDYKFSIDGSSFNFSKYDGTDGKTTLDLEDDAVHVNMGGNWRMPTLNDFKELLLNTDVYLVSSNGDEIHGTPQEQSGTLVIQWNSEPSSNDIKGAKFYKRGDRQTHLFIPAAGAAIRRVLRYVGQGAVLWTSSLDASNVRDCWLFSSMAYNGGFDYGDRYNGNPVRGVMRL